MLERDAFYGNCVVSINHVCHMSGSVSPRRPYCILRVCFILKRIETTTVFIKRMKYNKKHDTILIADPSTISLLRHFAPSQSSALHIKWYRILQNYEY